MNLKKITILLTLIVAISVISIHGLKKPAESVLYSTLFIGQMFLTSITIFQCCAS